MCQENKPSVWYCIEAELDADTLEIVAESESIEADLEEIERVASIARESVDYPQGSFSAT